MWCNSHQGEHCQVIVVTPLLSIMKEQCEYLTSLCFRATYIGRYSKEDDDILSGTFDFLFTSPENLLGVTKWRNMLVDSSPTKLVVVDEAHTILQWGESDTEDAPFRAWYGKLGENRSLMACPVLLKTATANRSARKNMQKKFCMKGCLELVHNPDRENIKLFVHKYKSTTPVCEVFQFLISMLKAGKEHCERFIIYCPSIKLCSELFTMFRIELDSDIQYVQMYHSNTTEVVKEEIKNNIMNNSYGHLRILVATSAAGMGVNFKGVNNVIHFGVPNSMDTFVQQFGRAGRDGLQSMALLLFNGKQCKSIDQDMKDYITSNDTCRRQTVLHAYNAKPSLTLTKHLCCDICSRICSCNTEVCTHFQHPYFVANSGYMSSSSDTEHTDSDVIDDFSD